MIVSIQVEEQVIGSEDSSLLDALRKTGIEIDTPCGGKGTCGKCAVRVVSGKVEPGDNGVLTETEISQEYVLACKAKALETHLEIEIPEQSAKTGGQFIDETEDTCLIHLEIFNEGRKPDPLTIKHFIEVPQPQLQDGLSDIDRLTRAIWNNIGKKEVSIPLPIIRKTAEVLREENGKVTVTIEQTPTQNRLIEIEPGDRTARHFGISVDIGTTTVAVQLVDLKTAKILATRTAYNDQVECGIDVISRINYARKPERLEELRNRVLKTINNLLEQICKADKIETGEIYSAVVAGNTTMTHLLLGLKPEHIRLEPYTPTILEAIELTAKEIGIEINPQATVYISPGVGSYVGGDITSGLLCTNIGEEKEGVNLFIDIGTNGELVIGNHEFLMTCACSAGPAFEGGGIENGMRASTGAIEKVEIEPVTGIANIQTIGNVKPKGICGSGMISLLAGLYQTGWLDASGKLNREKTSPSIKIEGRQGRYIIVTGEESATGKPIIITEKDIENIIRAKAAIYSACSLMLEQIGMGFEDLTNVFIAGGFGRNMDIEKSIIIGLLPDIAREKYHYLGNTSLMGAYKVLVSQEFKRRRQELTKRLTYIELSADPAYMDQYTGALFLPHTDIRRFPTILKCRPLFFVHP